MNKITEQESLHHNLEKLSTADLLKGINQEDQKVAPAVEKVIPQIEVFVDTCFYKMKLGGRLFYLGAGTSGRLGIVDASECPPTFGVDHGRVVGLMAGGDKAMRKAVEFAEDDWEQGWKDLKAHQFSVNDTLIGVAASGSTPYVLGAVEKVNELGGITAGITCNPESKLASAVQFPIVPVVGPEFVTGSTRMKSGTAQKLVLNMISTSLMIKLGHVKGNRMVDMQLTNNKLIERGANMIAEELQISFSIAQKLLQAHGSVRKAVDAYQTKNKSKIS
jgi:N-acetylmuramic acid 6-phosphate etherase